MSIQHEKPSARALSECRLPLTVPQHLAADLRQIADRDCSSLSATLRRLVARGVALEKTIHALAEVR